MSDAQGASRLQERKKKHTTSSGQSNFPLPPKKTACAATAQCSSLGIVPCTTPNHSKQDSHVASTTDGCPVYILHTIYTYALLHLKVFDLVLLPRLVPALKVSGVVALRKVESRCAHQRETVHVTCVKAGAHQWQAVYATCLGDRCM